MNEEVFVLETEPCLFKDHHSALPSDVYGYYNSILLTSAIPYTKQDEDRLHLADQSVAFVYVTVRRITQGLFRERHILALDSDRLHRLYCDIMAEEDRFEELETKARSRAIVYTRQAMIDQALDHEYESSAKHKLDQVMNLSVHDFVIVNVYHRVVGFLVSELRGMGNMYRINHLWPELITDQMMNNICAKFRL